MDRLVALEVIHVRVELPPLFMVDGLALKLLIVGAAGGGVTVTVAVAVADPAELVAVSV